MTHHAVENELERSTARPTSARGGSSVSSVQPAIDPAFRVRPSELRSGLDSTGLAMLIPAGLAAVAALVVMTEQPLLAFALSLAGMALMFATAVHRNRLDRADAVVLVGRSAIASIIANTIETRASVGRPVRIVRAPGSADVPRLLRSERCDEVVLAGPVGPLVMNLTDARGRRPAILSGPEKLEMLLGRVPLELAQQDKWLGRLGKIRSLDPGYARTKRLFDLLFAVGLGLVILPLLPIVALAIRLESPGSILYSQTRIGLGGTTFRIYKFRSMRQDAEKDGAKWAEAGDPRVTKVGRIMRLTRIDELPQIWNVLRGDMTVVGPRPERPEFTELLAKEIPGYDLRHTVKPGLTGWAQVCYRYTSSVKDTRNKVEYDLYYVKHLSLGLDARILARTVGVVLGRKGT